MDQDLWQADFLQCHPLVNTATLVISLLDIKKFLEATHHDIKFVAIGPSSTPPARS